MTVRVYSDNARMTSERDKNKVHYEPRANSMADVDTMRFQSTHAWLNGFYLFYTFFFHFPRVMTSQVSLVSLYLNLSNGKIEPH